MEGEKGISTKDFSPDFPRKFGYTRGVEEMKEILRYLAYHLLRQLDGRGGIRGYYRALLGDVQLVKIHSYPRHIPARGCIVRVRHSWNVRIIFYRDPFFFFFFFFFFLFTVLLLSYKVWKMLAKNYNITIYICVNIKLDIEFFHFSDV